MHPASRTDRYRILHFGEALLLVVLMTDISVAATRHDEVPTGNVSSLVCSAPPTMAAAKVRENSIARAAHVVVPSVVSITADSNGQESRGSGVIIRSDGTILTNNHVVADVGVNGGSLRISTANGRSAPATIVGRLPHDDIAVIRAAGLSGLPTATLASSASLRVGDAVIAVGNAMGQRDTVTAGIVSALRRPVCVTTPRVHDAVSELFGSRPSLPKTVRLHRLIQTDAPINPGNSGGALADVRGRVVGITTLNLTVGDAGASNGIGFAIPIEIAFRDAQLLIGRSH